MGRLNHHAIDNGDVEVHPSEFPVEFISEFVPDLDTTPIKSIDDDEMDHLLELFQSEHNEIASECWNPDASGLNSGRLYFKILYSL